MYDWVEGALRNVAVGLLPAALQGIDIRAMLAGARDGRRHPHTQIKNNPAALLTLLVLAGNGRGEKTWLCHTKTVCCCSVATYNNW